MKYFYLNISNLNLVYRLRNPILWQVNYLLSFKKIILPNKTHCKPNKFSSFAGFVALIGKSFGILIVGFVMTYFKPSPRLLMACNVFVGIFSVLIHSSQVFIDCSDQQIHGHWNPDHR